MCYNNNTCIICVLPGRRRGSGGRGPPDARAASTRCGEVKWREVCRRFMEGKGRLGQVGSGR